MRLGQLARKLEIRPADIVDFLSRRNIQIEEGSNTRVEDDHVTLTIKHFNPALLEEKIEEVHEVIEVPQPVFETTPEVTVEELPATENVTEEKISVESVSGVENGSSQIEVIKAVKAELPGLKVLGKIELPEVKKKESTNPVAGEVVENQSAPFQRAPRRNSNSSRREEAWKNPIELQREREASEAEEKRKAQRELEKEKRMVHYLKKVKKSAQPSRNQGIETEKDEEIKIKKAEAPPKTWFGKFMKWLSTP